MKKKMFVNSKNVLTFKKWKDAGYAVFATLNRYVKIGVLATVYFNCLGVYTSFAQVDTDSINKRINLSEVEISGMRNPALYSEVGRIVTVLSRNDIENMAVYSVQDLLKTMPGVDVRTRGPVGAQADISVRGGTSDQVMILLNGINISDPQSGHHALNLPIDINSIERIEIIQGAAAHKFGANAFNGAINFITTDNESNKVKVNGSYGENNLYSFGGTINQQINNNSNFIAVQKSTTDGYIDNTDFDFLNLYLNSNFDFDKEKLSFQFGYSDKNFGANSFYSAKYPNQYENTKTLFTAISHSGGNIIKNSSKIYWRRHHDRFELFRGNKNTPDWYEDHNYHLTDVVGATMNLSVKSVVGTTSIGGEVRAESVWSNVLGLPLPDSVKVAKQNSYYTNGFSRVNSSLFLEHKYSIGSWNLMGALLLNNNSQSNTILNLFPGLDVDYWINDNFKIMVSANKSMRLPTFTDLFYNGPDNVGNQGLKPEIVTAFEIGERYRNSYFELSSSLFYRFGESLIDWGKLIGEERYKTSNINSITTIGVDFSYKLFVEKLVKQSFIKVIGIDYNWIDQEKDVPENYQSVYVLNHLRHKLSINSQHSLGLKGLDATWNFAYRDRNGDYLHSISNEKIAYNPFWLVDLKINYSRKYYNIFVEATNLFDVTYSDFGELIQPGRWVRVGFNLNLSY